MTKLEKRIRKIAQQPKGTSSQELIGILESLGFHCRSGKGSHTVCHHPDLPGVFLTIPDQRPLLPVYIRKALKIIYQLQEMREDE